MPNKSKKTCGGCVYIKCLDFDGKVWVCAAPVPMWVWEHVACDVDVYEMRDATECSLYKGVKDAK